MTRYEVADALSCRWQWLAFLYGDLDPQVAVGARKYAMFIFSQEASRQARSEGEVVTSEEHHVVAEADLAEAEELRTEYQDRQGETTLILRALVHAVLANGCGCNQ